MDAEYANYYTREVMLILIREFQSPDEEMKKIVLKVIVPNCCCSRFVNLNVFHGSKRILYHLKKTCVLNQDCDYYYYFLTF